MLSSVPAPTLVGIGALVLSRFAQLISFFLPLKVLIMLSSDRVPRAFESIITAENRHLWLIGFAVATFVFYATSVFLETVANRTIHSGLKQLLNSQGGLEKEKKQEQRRQYTTYCVASSEAAIFLIGSLGLAIINPVVLIGMIGLIFAELSITGWLLEADLRGFLGWVKGGISRRVNVWIQYLSAVNFLALFVLILLDILISQQINIYIAVATMILGRQTFNSLAKFVKRMLSLHRRDEDDEEDLSTLKSI
jgi:hypothetical protein